MVRPDEARLDVGRPELNAERCPPLGDRRGRASRCQNLLPPVVMAVVPPVCSSRCLARVTASIRRATAKWCRGGRPARSALGLAVIGAGSMLAKEMLVVQHARRSAARPDRRRRCGSPGARYIPARRHCAPRRRRPCPRRTGRGRRPARPAQRPDRARSRKLRTITSPVSFSYSPPISSAVMSSVTGTGPWK